MIHRQRFLDLQGTLQAHAGLWRPSPFHVDRPEWCREYSRLADEVLALDESTVEAFTADADAASAWVAARLPVVAALGRLCDLPRLPQRGLPERGPHADRYIPGRKLDQIDAFAAHGPRIETPIIEWCAGKGHLGRRLALIDRRSVELVEINRTLCDEAERLAAPLEIEQTVVCGDALSPGTRAGIRGRVVVALHACGELHRTLVRNASGDGAHSYRIAPCCYHLGADNRYRAVSQDASLALDDRTLRLAVTETVTAPRHVRARLEQDQVRKLGFIALRRELTGETARSFRPIPAAWRTLDFAGYCRALATREGLALPAGVDWDHWEHVGARRRGEVRRLEIVRHAFRRALEVWLVLDLVRGFEEAGFVARLGTFCERRLTPRNLLILAERA